MRVPFFVSTSRRGRDHHSFLVGRTVEFDPQRLTPTDTPTESLWTQERNNLGITSCTTRTSHLGGTVRFQIIPSPSRGAQDGIDGSSQRIQCKEESSELSEFTESKRDGSGQSVFTQVETGEILQEDQFPGETSGKVQGG
jgi:hypothetical protein